MDNYKLQRCGLLREDADIVSPNHLGSSSFITNGGKYYYHSYYLGSSTLITNGDGFITQQIDYLPYGEVFLEKQRNTDDYLSPYKFNGKELDEETGLYYYGARYMNPRLSIWYGTDPLEEKCPDVSSYSYCQGNPVVLFDNDGNSPISIFAKQAAKYGIKKAAKATIKKVVSNKLKAYASKKWAKQLMNDALTSLDIIMGQEWWEYVVDVIPIVGDAWGGYKLTAQGSKIWKSVERIENRVAAIENALKGVNSGKLRKTLKLTSGEAHHIIPVQMLKESDVVQDAVSAGFDFNGVINGIKANAHHGPHNNYNN